MNQFNLWTCCQRAGLRAKHTVMSKLEPPKYNPLLHAWICYLACDLYCTCKLYIRTCGELVLLTSYTFSKETVTFMKSVQVVSFTVFARSDATATIYFIVQFCVASIWKWLLIESGIYLTLFSVKSFLIVRALRKASFIRLTKNCDAVTWFWNKQISLHFATKQYLHGTSNPFLHFLPMISHNDRPPCLKNSELLWTAWVPVPIAYTYSCHSRHEVVHVRMCYLNVSRG